MPHCAFAEKDNPVVHELCEMKKKSEIFSSFHTIHAQRDYLF